MSAIENSYAANATATTPRRVLIPLDYKGPLRPFGNGMQPNESGNGWNILVENPMQPEMQGLLFVFTDVQKAEVESVYQQVIGGNEFACLIAGPEGEFWSGAACTIRIRELGDTHAAYA